jgi:hypothetical protein
MESSHDVSQHNLAYWLRLLTGQTLAHRLQIAVATKQRSCAHRPWSLNIFMWPIKRDSPRGEQRYGPRREDLAIVKEDAVLEDVETADR